MSNWIRATKQNRCPICDHDHYCGWTDDGAVIHCMRISEGSFKEDQKNGGWFHRTDKYDASRKYTPRPKQPKPVQDMTDLNYRFLISSEQMESFSKELGVSILSLRKLGAGWDGEVYTFPMRNEYDKIIGISRRTEPQKCCVVGSNIGIFWPDSVSSQGKTRLFIVEGPTDCAAMLDMGFDVIGRQGCLGCVDIIQRFLQQGRREVIIVADRDEAKKGPIEFPGIDGAMRLAGQIKDLTAGLCVIQPPKYKDVREWYRAGATKPMIENFIRNMRYIA